MNALELVLSFFKNSVFCPRFCYPGDGRGKGWRVEKGQWDSVEVDNRQLLFTVSCWDWTRRWPRGGRGSWCRPGWRRRSLWCRGHGSEDGFQLVLAQPGLSKTDLSRIWIKIIWIVTRVSPVLVLWGQVPKNLEEQEWGPGPRCRAVSVGNFPETSALSWWSSSWSWSWWSGWSWWQWQGWWLWWYKSRSYRFR